jgi:AAA family ATP:ADP antiporter
MARGWIERVFEMRGGEFRLAVLSALQFFCLLFGYFMLRPLRETMGLREGVDSLRVLFLVTVGTMVVANVVYGFVASSVPRRVLVPGVYGFAILCLGGFLAALGVSGGEPGEVTGKVFYVWLSVFNLFAVAVFWSLLADVFTLEQGKRLFGFIGAGGTAGAIAGSGVAWQMAGALGPFWMMAIASVLIAASAGVSIVLGRSALGRVPESASHDDPDHGDGPVPGSAWSGLTRLVSSRYLTGIGATVMIYTVTSTLLYFEKMRIVEASIEGDAARTSLFAGIELAAQILTIVMQVFLTSRLMRWLGVGALLMAVPAVTAVGFGVLGLFPALAVLIVFEATRRASNFALSKPARETLFTVVPREDKYKAKAGIDTFLYRGGDSVGTLVDKGLAALAVPVAAVAIPLGIAGAWLAWWLGRRESELAAALPPLPLRCPECGYDLSDLPEPRCPECGIESPTEGALVAS